MKYVKSQRSYGFLITKELIFGFQILDLKDQFSASLISKPAMLTKVFSKEGITKIQTYESEKHILFVRKGRVLISVGDAESVTNIENIANIQIVLYKYFQKI